MVLTRKIIQQEYSFLVCLPKHWAELQGIKRGDDVIMIITKSGDLVIKGRKNEFE